MIVVKEGSYEEYTKYKEAQVQGMKQDEEGAMTHKGQVSKKQVSDTSNAILKFV